MLVAGIIAMNILDICKWASASGDAVTIVVQCGQECRGEPAAIVNPTDVEEFIQSLFIDAMVRSAKAGLARELLHLFVKQPTDISAKRAVARIVGNIPTSRISRPFVALWSSRMCVSQVQQRGENAMRMLVLVGLVCAFAGSVVGSAYAQNPTCKAQATQKKLAGAALNSFMKKCESDAQKACDTSAANRKLAGAAKASFTKKCVTDAVGT
jgi:hypothetical protein